MIRCSHILQKHTKSRNPKDSYRNKIITRSPEEAMQNIIKIRQELLEKGVKENFARIAQEVSECSLVNVEVIWVLLVEVIWLKLLKMLLLN